MDRSDGTTSLSFQIGLGPVWVTGIAWPPTSESTYNPSFALNAYDPTQTFLVPVRVGDAQQATDAVNLETVQAMFASLGLSPTGWGQEPFGSEPGMFDGTDGGSARYFAGNTAYG